MRIGKNQIDLLRCIARPGTALVVGDKISRSLVARGMAHEFGPDRWITITPSGLRALADAAETGRLELQFSPSAKPE